MENMRFKVGDRVRIKSLDWYNKNKDENGNIRYKHGNVYPIFFTKYMSRFCGETVTIKCVHTRSYHMNETGSCEFWTDEMIEGLAEEETYESLKTDKPNLPSLNDFMDMLNNELKAPKGYILKEDSGDEILTSKNHLGEEENGDVKNCCNMAIIVRDIQDKEMTIYNPDGSILVITHNTLCVNDILLQIREQKLSGYMFQIEGRNYKQEITSKGHIKQGFPHIYADQLKALMGF